MNNNNNNTIDRSIKKSRQFVSTRKDLLLIFSFYFYLMVSKTRIFRADVKRKTDYYCETRVNSNWVRENNRFLYIVAKVSQRLFLTNFN